MAFLDKVSETINNTGREVVDKAKELKEIVSLSAQITANENLISKYYREMGQYLYEHRHEEVGAGLEERFELIDTAYEEIARMKKELAAKKGMKICPGCGAELAKDAAFCSKCGTAAPADPAEEVPAEEVTEVPPEGAKESEEGAEAPAQEAEGSGTEA